MAAVLTTTTINNGAGSAISGGVASLERTGNQTTGPFSFVNALVDGVTGTTLATIKPASTTAVSADTALVVAFNPLSNSVQQAGTWTTVVSGTAFVSGGNVTAVVSGTTFISGGTMTSVVTGSARAARNYVGTTVPVGNLTALAANQAVQFLFLQNTHTGANIAIAFATPAILNSTASLMLGPGQSISWGPTTFGVPSGALNANASQTAPLYIEWI